MELAEHVIIGGEEWCAFPGLHIPAIKARVDSGKDLYHSRQQYS